MRYIIYFYTKTSLATWDTPPLEEDGDYSAFEAAFRGFIQSRKIRIPLMSKQRAADFDERGGRKRWDPTVVGISESGTYDIGQADQLKLIDFQVTLKTRTLLHIKFASI